VSSCAACRGSPAVLNPYLSQIERGRRRPSCRPPSADRQGLRFSAEQLLLLAGIPATRHGDPHLIRLWSPTRAHRAADQALLEIYESFRRENALVPNPIRVPRPIRPRPIAPSIRPFRHRRSHPLAPRVKEIRMSIVTEALTRSRRRPRTGKQALGSPDEHANLFSSAQKTTQPASRRCSDRNRPLFPRCRQAASHEVTVGGRTAASRLCCRPDKLVSPTATCRLTTRCTTSSTRACLSLWSSRAEASCTNSSPTAVPAGHPGRDCPYSALNATVRVTCPSDQGLIAKSPKREHVSLCPFDHRGGSGSVTGACRTKPP